MRALAGRLMPGVFPEQSDRAERDRLRAERRAQYEAEMEQQRRFTEFMNAQPRQEFKVRSYRTLIAQNRQLSVLI